MKEEYRKFAASFAETIIAEDYAAAHQLLADYVQRVITPHEFRALIEAQLREVADAAGLDELTYPTAYEIDGNSCSLQDLREDRAYVPERRAPSEIPAEITPESFRKWLCIQFQPNPEQQAELDVDAWMDFWILLVEEAGQYRIGYFQIDDPD